MKQLLKNIRDGKNVIADVPVPALRPGMALVRTAASLVSVGTERMVVEFAEKGLVGKALSRPDQVRQVLDKARREGAVPALEAVFNRLDQPMALGYSSAGTIVAVGEGVEGVHVGDRVACAGGGFAVHAEYTLVPINLLARLPDSVDFESAAFATLGAIALQGFRLARPQVGEKVAIIGLGLLGLLSVAIARAAGCTVFGIDLDPTRVELAQKMGAFAVSRDGAEDAGRSFSQGRGFDSVLICADTASDDPVTLAGELARDRGVVVAVGAVGMDIPRKIYYEKELQFLISRSYGPGRYDSNYEEKGQDYPYGYVRWTEGRNLAAIVDLIGTGRMDVHPLITHRFAIEQAEQAYELISGKSAERFLGVLITYPQVETSQPASKVEISDAKATMHKTGEPALGILGAGNYASATFLPVVASVGGAARIGIASAAGLTARHAAEKYGFSFASSSEQEVLQDQRINVVAILTRHNQHARQAATALANGKAVFCEKPLAIDEDGLAAVENALQAPDAPMLTVGYNRRFAPFSQRLAGFLANRSEPMAVHYRVNAGFLPAGHWLHDPVVGGGRIIGEGCHFIDYLIYLTGSVPLQVQAMALPDNGRYHQDNVVMTFTFKDGSIGTVTYLANGDKTFPKERVEVFCGGRVAVLEDYRSLELTHGGRKQTLNSRLRQDKGHRTGWETFLKAVGSGGQPPIPYDQLFGGSRAAIAAVRSLQSGSVEVIE
ncbi:MAG TPA: bi-domain-containing oxidoreductase [Bellilinea sp.]|nr:bi-domain-containing oxidoreductase [Bellilinea sp.]